MVIAIFLHIGIYIEVSSLALSSEREVHSPHQIPERSRQMFHPEQNFQSYRLPPLSVSTSAACHSLYTHGMQRYAGTAKPTVELEVGSDYHTR